MLGTGESQECPSTVSYPSVYGEDERADAAWSRTKMIDEGANLIERVLVDQVAVGLGFGDKKVCTRTEAMADYIRSVATYERRHWISGRLLKVCAH